MVCLGGDDHPPSLTFCQGLSTAFSYHMLGLRQFVRVRHPVHPVQRRSVLHRAAWLPLFPIRSHNIRKAKQIEMWHGNCYPFMGR